MELILLSIREDDVVFEDYGDEMVLLHLRRGVYYTLDRVGSDCLSALMGASSLERALHWLADRYDAPEEDLRACLAELASALGNEDLVIPRQGGEPAIALETGESILSKRPLTQPLLEKYQDIQDILRFDPVHEVTEQGWPSIRNDVREQQF